MKSGWLVVLVLSSVAAVAGTQSLTGNLQDKPWQMSLKPEVQFSDIGGDFASLAGVQLCSEIYHTVYIGIGGYGLLNAVEPADSAYRLGSFDFWYAGGVADYTFLADRVFHGSVNVLVGGGQVKPGAESDAVFVATPGVSLQVNLTPGLELGAGVGYRFVSGSTAIPNAGLNKVWGSLFLRFNETLF